MAASGSSDDESSSDDDDETPLANLTNRKRIRTPIKYNEESSDDDDEAEFEDEEEDSAEADDGDEDDDSDDDDVPLAQISKKKKSTPRPKSKTKSKTKSTTTKKKKKVKRAPKKKPIKREIVDPSSTSAMVTPSSELYSKSIKGKIIRSLLCRWWYAITWPDPSTLPKNPPVNCDSLDGFPGVYVHTSGEEVGKVVDYRDGLTCPNFKNMVKKSSRELKELLLKAIDVQREQLVENEGEGTRTQKDLRDLEKWAKKVNEVKADKEANTVLKAAGFSV